MNRLSSATSPYLLQHQHNPVDWWPWGEEALAEAQRSGRPIILSVGYAACHWCHVMAHESFEDEATAAVMNELFVNIKVDREERPDVDHLYMSALHALGERGGWPMTMFLTPDGSPFWGGTYYPKVASFGRPDFISVLREVSRAFHNDRDRIAKNCEILREALAKAEKAPDQAGLGREQLDEIAEGAIKLFDPIDGGLNGAPKFPNPGLLEMLWRYADRTGNADARALLLKSLERMALGGIQDHLGGGFARYSTDERWLVPHFEKMLYDNGQLLELYALAAHETGRPLFREAAEGIVTWLEREMITPEGAFCASLDADSEGEEGRFYVWTAAEIAEVLGDDFATFKPHYDVSRIGNWEGHLILNRLDAPEPDEATAARLAVMRAKLLERRSHRVRPGLDDKVLADWNALMIAGLVRGAVLLDKPEWIDLAKRAFDFITGTMARGGQLGHSWRAGQLLFPGFASDHAAMARAALILHEATGEASYHDHARTWLDILARDYADPDTGILAMTPAGASDLVARLRPTHDEAVPNANGHYAEALVRFSMAEGGADDISRADRILDRLTATARPSPLGHASIVNALDLRLNGSTIIVAGPNRTALRQASLAVGYPKRIVIDLASDSGLPPDHPAAALVAAAGEGAALICRGEQCSLPLRSTDEIKAEMQPAYAGT